MPLKSCTGGHTVSKSSRHSKIMGYNPRNPPRTRKSWVITHENGQKRSKSRVLLISLESCTWGHRVSKSSLDPKIMGYNPRKHPKMAQMASFANATRVVYRDSKIMGYNPRKRPKIVENTSFSDASKVVYRGSQGIEILPRRKNHGL